MPRFYSVKGANFGEWLKKYKKREAEEKAEAERKEAEEGNKGDNSTECLTNTAPKTS